MSTWQQARYLAEFGNRRRETAGRMAGSATGWILAAGILATGGAGWWMSSPWLVWAALPAALWLALAEPVWLVGLLLVTTPVFPVIRLAEDVIGAQQVSTKGVFFSLDDPLILALLAAWVLRRPRARTAEMFPQALAGLLVLYPAVIAANAMRLDPNQVLVSLMYYIKWAEYAVLMYALPRVLGLAGMPAMVNLFRNSLLLVACLCGGFAVYEVAEAVRTSSYTAAAGFPRASSFFGSLDAARFGASEDPVNFGVFAMLTGSVALAMMSQSGARRPWMVSAATGASLVSLVLAASRAPWLAAGVAYARIQRLRSARVVLGVAAVLIPLSAAYLVYPDYLAIITGRFSAIGEGQGSGEYSAVDRLAILANSPVFEIDAYWALGHGHSSYRFVAEEHLAGITGGVSRSLYNFGLTVWYDAGPAGLVLWIALFVQLKRRLGRIASSSPSREVRALAWGLHGALWGLAAAAMFSEVPYNWRVMGFFYASVGICIAADSSSRRMWAARQ